MDITLSYGLIEKVIIAEVLLVLAIIVFTYAMKFVYYYRGRRKQEIREAASRRLQDLLLKKESFTLKALPAKARRLDVLIPVFHEFDETVKDEQWPEMKEAIVKLALLDEARKKTLSKRWVARCWAVQCFECYAEPQDEDLVIRLVKDPIPLVQFHAAHAAIKLGTARVINEVITRMAEERRLAQSIFLEAFEHELLENVQHVEERLLKETDPYAKAACYKVLLLTETLSKVMSEAIADCCADNIELKLMAIRVVAHSNKERNVKALMNLLNDDTMAVRATAASCLGELQANKAVGAVSNLLRDSEWWVRLNAAKALTKLGEDGVSILKMQSPEEDKFAYEVATHVLRIRTQ